MGLDRFANFISKYTNNDIIEELYINDNIKKKICNHVIFDLNFFIYQEIIELENEINDIIKIILTLPFALNKKDVLENILNKILDQEHWKYYSNNIIDILDCFDENIIITNFINFLTKIINLNELNINKTSLLEIILNHKIVLSIINNITNLHHLPFIKNISIFCDGIPAFSKIIEQRRRRIKTYLESNNKKIAFKKYFNVLESNFLFLKKSLSKTYIDIDDTLIFDYIKWIKYRFSIDKTVSPSSNLLLNLEIYIKHKLNYYLPNININVNSSQENGESDLKIFKFIGLNNNHTDYCIHTSDSDLIQHMLVQQTYYKIINKDINITIIRYLKYNNMQILEGNLIIKNILELYNNINNIKTNNYKIIWDLCLIFYFFGNDHLPLSLEVGSELGLEFYLKTHFKSLNNNNIINIKNNKPIFNIKNLLLYLEKINETNEYNITKIILNRYFKINLQSINILVEKFNLNFLQIQDFFKKLIIFNSVNLSEIEFNKLNNHDLIKILVKDMSKDELNNYKSINIFNLNETNTIILKDYIKILESNINYFESEYMGLILYNKNIFLTNDNYQDLYNYMNDNICNNLNNTYPLFYGHINLKEYLKLLNNINLNNSNNVNDYIKYLYYLVNTQFGNMNNYNSNNITYYKYNYTPSLNQMILFIKNISDNIDIINLWDNDILNDTIDDNKYFNLINHYLIISPFISSINFNNKIKNIDNLILSKDNINIFEYKNIDINLYLNLCNNF